jgi:hypothetical protein
MNVLQTEGAVINYPKEGWQNSLVHVHLGCKQDHLGETAMHTRQAFKHRHLLSRLALIWHSPEKERWQTAQRRPQVFH